MLPQAHPYVVTGNRVEAIFGSKYVAVIGITPKSGDVYQPAVLGKVQRISAALLKTPGVVKENILSFSARRANKWLHETLEAELAAVYDCTRRDYLLRPKIGYAFDDHWNGKLGATLFRGDADTFFGMLRNRSAVYGELR
ncbi:MAG: hypothetical protein OEV23_01605 [Gallionella sp.]|nr:hypothetical protein [Gallionella sp.]